jgi:hypothetical protein
MSYAREVIDAIDKTANVSFSGEETYENMIWEPIETKPTKAEFETKLAEVSYKNELFQTRIQRQKEYPSIEDQLDKIYHEGVDAWKAEIQAIKEKFPKPEITNDN